MKNDPTFNGHIHDFDINNTLVREHGIFAKCKVKGCRMHEDIKTLKK